MALTSTVSEAQKSFSVPVWTLWAAMMPTAEHTSSTTVQQLKQPTPHVLKRREKWGAFGAQQRCAQQRESQSGSQARRHIAPKIAGMIHATMFDLA